MTQLEQEYWMEKYRQSRSRYDDRTGNFGELSFLLFMGGVGLLGIPVVDLFFQNSEFYTQGYLNNTRGLIRLASIVATPIAIDTVVSTAAAIRDGVNAYGEMAYYRLRARIEKPKDTEDIADKKTQYYW